MKLQKYITAIKYVLKNIVKELKRKRSLLVLDGDFHLNNRTLDFSGHNFGDDLNIPLLDKLTHRQIIPRRHSIFHRHCPYLTAIGSVLGQCISNQAVVWGSGLIEPLKVKPLKPIEIFAVRGPRTRDELIKFGLNCPVIYGDPAICLPQCYTPAIPATPKYKLGIIPHLSDMGNPYILKIQHALGNDCQIIDIKNYGTIENFIQKICDCQVIISSSLHGLIVADTFGIPAARIKFRQWFENDDFKFEDWYLSHLEMVPETINPDLFIKNISNYIAKIAEDCACRNSRQKIAQMAEKLLSLLPAALQCVDSKKTVVEK